jgi:glycosyltransferase involved in cell wall biosynthesis
MITAILPALDEEAVIGSVVSGVKPHVDRVIVVDNGSGDRTAERAAEAGADVVHEARRGYGSACLAGVGRARGLEATVLVFLDADGSDDPSDLPSVLMPVVAGEADLSLGVRASRWIEPGSMTGVQRAGNVLAPLLMRLLVGANYHDMPPQKAISVAAFERLGVRDTGHGFTIELLLKAHEQRLRLREVDVHWRRRAGGQSKVSGTLVGSARAAIKILGLVGRHTVAIRLGRDESLVGRRSVGRSR